MELAPEHWQLGCVKIQERIAYLIQSGHRSDCKFLVGPEPCPEVIEGHKAILASASPVFEAMFFGPIPIPDIQPRTFRALLRYIYADDLKISSLDEAINLYYAAKKYILPHLLKECFKYIDSNVTWKNACRLYEFASLFDEKELLNKCLQTIRTCTKQVITDISFEEVQMSTVITIFSLERINCTELDLFEAAERYAISLEKRIETYPESNSGTLKLESSVSKDIVVVNVENSENKRPEEAGKSLKQDKASVPAKTPSESKEKPNIRAAIERIRFLTLTSQQFAEGPAKSSLLTKSEKFAIYMNIIISSSRASGVPMPKGFSICRQKRYEVPPNNNQNNSVASNVRR